MEHLNDTLMSILAKHSGKTAKVMKKACDRDNFMSAQASVDFGLVDKIIGA
jgi:ATP-dependent Clp protease protease subunit